MQEDDQDLPESHPDAADPSEEIPEYAPEAFSWVHEIDAREVVEDKGENEWEGLSWQFFEVRDGCYYKFYAGVDSTFSMPSTWDCKFNVDFEFLDTLVLKPELPLNCDFQMRGGSTMRQDQGFSNRITLVQIDDEVKARRNDPTYTQTYGEENIIKVRITVKRAFRTRNIPFGWNSREKTGMLGLRNLGATCYLNALLQMLYHMNAFRTAVYRIPVEGEILESSITLALQDVFRNLQVAPAVAIGAETCVTTKHLTKAFGWTTSENFLQQDATELLKFLIDRLELKMGPDAIKILFEGSTKNFIRCVNVQMESSHEEAFQDIQLDVEGCDNIYESMRKFVAVERLDGENQYDAGEEHGKQDAEKGTAFTKFPHILTIHLKRFAFNPHTMSYSKIHTRFAFPEILDMEKFLTRSPDSNPEPSIYRLHSILIHRGDVGSGHYYSYVKPSPLESAAACGDPPADPNAQPPLPRMVVSENVSGSGWYRFDDERVYDVEKAEAVDYHYGRGKLNQTAASAYMLMYIRESMMDTIMKSVSVDDIPASLSEHLDSEHRRLQQDQFVRMRPKISDMKYYLPEDLESFHNYGVGQDLCDFPFGAEHTVSLFDGSSRLAAVFQIAVATDTPICDFVLLKMKKSVKDGRFATLRPWKWYIDGYDQMADSKLCDSLWELEKLDAFMNNPLLLVHRNQTCVYVQNAEHFLEEQRVKDCIAEWTILREEEAVFLDELHSICKECVPGMASPDYNPKNGCNVLNSDKFLELVQKYKSNLNSEIVDRIKHSQEALKIKFFRHFMQYGNFMRQLTEGPRIPRRVLFAPLKIFDEHCLLPKLEALPLGVNSLRSREELSKADEHAVEKKIFKFVKFIVVVVDEQRTPMLTRDFYNIIEHALKSRCPTYDADGDLQLDAFFTFSQSHIVPLEFPSEKVQENVFQVIQNELKTGNFLDESEWKSTRQLAFEFSFIVVLSVSHSLKEPQSPSPYQTWAENLSNNVSVTLVPTCKTDAEIALNLGRGEGGDSMELDSEMEYIRHLSFHMMNDNLLDMARKIGEELCIPLERLVLVIGAPPQPRKKFVRPLQFWPYTKQEKDAKRHEEITLDDLRNHVSLLSQKNKMSVTIYYRVVPFPLCRIAQLSKHHQQASGPLNEQSFCQMDLLVADSGGGSFPLYSEVKDIRNENTYLEVHLVDATLRKLRRQEISIGERNGHGPWQAHSQGNISDMEGWDAGGGKRVRLTQQQPSQSKDAIVAFFDHFVDKVYCAVDKNSSWASQLRDKLGIPKTSGMISPHGLEFPGRGEASDISNHSDDDLALIFFLSDAGSADVLIDDSNTSQAPNLPISDNWLLGYYEYNLDTLNRIRCVPPEKHASWFTHPVDLDTFQLTGPPREQIHLCAQLVRASDLRCMRGETIMEGGKEVRCTIVRVYFFTLQGPVASCMHFDVETTEDEGAIADGTRRHNRSFLSFVREDDSYKTLHARLSLIVCGDEDAAASTDMDNCGGTDGPGVPNGISAAPLSAGGRQLGRVAVISDKRRVQFLPEQKGSLIWDKLQIAYPLFCENTFQEALLKTKHEGGTHWNFDNRTLEFLPTLGIQLSEGKLKDTTTRRPTSSLLSKRKASDTNMSMK